jgi:hypothetical protein
MTLLFSFVSTPAWIISHCGSLNGEAKRLTWTRIGHLGIFSLYCTITFMSPIDRSIATHTLSPVECRKILEGMKDLKSQLIFLNSMEPDQVMSTLASVEERTRISIMHNIPQLYREEMSRQIAAFQATKYQPFSTSPTPSPQKSPTKQKKR